jgi:hypothetical protein
MALVLFIWGVVVALYGLFVFSASKSALHEMEAGIAFLVATLAFSACCILDAINELQKSRIQESNRKRLDAFRLTRVERAISDQKR